MQPDVPNILGINKTSVNIQSRNCGPVIQEVKIVTMGCGGTRPLLQTSDHDEREVKQKVVDKGTLH